MLFRCLCSLVISFGIGLPSAAIASASTIFAPQQPEGLNEPSSGETDFFASGDSRWNEHRNSSFANSAPPQFGSRPFETPHDPTQDLQRSSGRPQGIPIGLEAEWIADSDVGLSTLGAGLKLPLLFGSKPPPIMKFGFAYTDLSSPHSLDVPNDLYEYSTGLSWVKRFNERWAVRTLLGVDFATDHLNTSSDAWRFTGGVFAICKTNQQLSWTFGALALGRSDLPVVPAVGAVWLPTPTTRIDFILPNPKANFLLSDNGQRQQWAYLGGGLNGNSWAFERSDQVDDTLTYSDLRLVAGWQSRPSAPANAPYVVGRKYIAEIGYAFSRKLEFENESIEVPLDDAVTFRLSTQF